MIEPMTLTEHILFKQSELPEATGDLSNILGAIQLAAKVVHKQINRAGLLDILGSAGETNVQGETQQKLDVYANERFKRALEARGHVCGIASEEEANFVALDASSASSKYVVAIDPIDGSSNIDVNVPVGTIFSIYRRLSPESGPVALSDFLQRGRVQVAAGYVIYGTSTMLVYTTGKGVDGFTLDATVGDFFLSHEQMRFPSATKVFSINEGHSSQFSLGIQKFVAWCKALDNIDGTGVVQTAMSGRYVGSLVADFHRNLIQGGIYLYPGLTKAPEGKLRLLYECNPLAMLAEQAGGVASDGHMRILDIDPRQLHQRSPLFIGPVDTMDVLLRCLAELDE